MLSLKDEFIHTFESYYSILYLHKIIYNTMKFGNVNFISDQIYEEKTIFNRKHTAHRNVYYYLYKLLEPKVRSMFC